MSKFANSFETIYEALITRATTGCFSAGDVVTFDSKSIQKHKDYQSLTKELKSRLDDMMRTSDNGESVIVVTDTTLGVLNGTKAPSPSTITIAYSQGGGRWVEPITIPGSLTEFMTAQEAGVNLVDKIPSVAKIEYPVFTKAEEIDLKELEKNRTKGHASSTLHGESWERNKPTSLNFDEFGVDRFGGRDSDGIYTKILVNGTDVENFMKECREEWGIKNGAEKTSNISSQPFIKAAEKILTKDGSKGLAKYFSKFADFVLKKLNKWELLSKTIPDKNNKIDKWNTARSKEIGKKYSSKNVDQLSKAKTLISVNWNTYWRYFSTDYQECAWDFPDFYSKYQKESGDNTSLKDVVKVFDDKLK